MKELKGKKIFSVEENNRVSINITFEDGTILYISHHQHGLHTNITKDDPPKEKVFPWKQNEVKFITQLSQEDKKEYEKTREAFFWLLENHEKVRDRYSYFDKNWRETRSSFSMQIDMDKDDPKGILTIFFSFSVAPECDDWFELGLKRDWKRILEMKDEVEKGK